MFIARGHHKNLSSRGATCDPGRSFIRVKHAAPMELGIFLDEQFYKHFDPTGL